MPDLARLTPCWPGNWVVEGMEMLCFKAREPPHPPGVFRTQTLCHSPTQSCSIRPWGAWGRGVQGSHRNAQQALRAGNLSVLHVSVTQ